MANNGVSISPASISINETETYTLTVSNTTNVDIIADIKYQHFSIDPNTKKIIPSNSAQTERLANIDYLEFEDGTKFIPARENIEVKVKLNSHPEFGLAGILVKAYDSQNKNIALETQLAQLVLNKNLTSKDLDQIKSKLEVKLERKLGEINIGNAYEIYTEIDNQSNKFLDISGNVSLYINDKRIEKFLPINISGATVIPLTQVNDTYFYKDNRPFWERIGVTKLTQEIRISPENILRTDKVFLTVPIDLIIILIFVLFISVLLSITGYRLKRYSKINKT